MPELDPNNLRISSASRAIEIQRSQLNGAMGIRSKLNVSCLVGIDAILADAIDGKLPESNLPCVRMAFQTSDDEMASNAGVILNREIHTSLFFLYYLGKNTGTVLPTKFTDLRDRHINDNLEYLRLQGSDGNPSGIGLTKYQFLDDAGKTFWWWPRGDQIIHREHETPFDVLGVTLPINPSSGMACSRVDYTFMVRNHATFLMLNKFISYEIPSGTINGTNGSDGNPTFTLANKIAGDINGNPAITYVSVNGQQRYPAIGFTAEIGQPTITFIAPYIPVAGDKIGVGYYAY